ncbi:MAG: aspartyl protease family protein [Bacteroidales bacterium]|nr:aspartyl protease family protein [Bacteroidales bacterium]
MRKLTPIVFLLLMLHMPFAACGKTSGFSFDRQRSHITVPIIVRNNLAVVTLNINGRGPFHFILDTGVNTTILTEPLISHLLNLNIQETILVYGLGGEGIVEAYLATGVEISMRGITGKNMNMIVIPEDILSFSEIFGFPVVGIIGHDFFRNFPVEISYSSEVMKVYRTPDYRIHRRSKIIPFELINGKPYVNSTIYGHNGEKINTNLLIDLGASHPLYLNRHYMDLSENTISGFLGKGISGNLLGKMGRVKKISLGDIYIKEPLVSYPDAEFLKFEGHHLAWEGIIGGGIMKRFNVIIDYPSELMVLRKGNFFSQPFHTNLSGMEVVSRGPRLRQFVIHYVRPGSSAYEAGLAAGDQIIQMNRKYHHELTLESILDELSGKTGSVITIVVLREREVLRKQFRLREDLL